MVALPVSVVLQALDHIERLEAPLLSWGLVDGGFTKDEMFASLDRISHRVGYDAGDLLDSLLDAGLVVRLHYSGTDVFRSRLAETVRLLARQRQLFEDHLHGNGWRVAPTLVADYRLQLRPRRYPRRDTSLAQLRENLGETGIAVVVQAFISDLVAARSDADEFVGLSGFQVRSTIEILRNLGSAISSGVIVTAGTGSGKTFAYYLPALADIAHMVDSATWVKSVAIYPRNELLKDQFSETYVEARRLDDSLARVGGRRITIGAFFGQTPHTSRQVTESEKWGKKVGTGWRCPYVRCPTCDGDMLWLEEDARRDRENLTCARRDCGSVIRSDEVVLTRRRMAAEPPDVVFTTTEMLNQRLGDTSFQHVFGIGPRAPRKPRTVLLDEVHTYSGSHGAQVALLLRRWQHALGRPVVFVGLSATLRDAANFFADLSGVPSMRVSEVGPTESELTTEGVEYLIALRGDPGSGASLLSTTIQTAMLLRRTLDPSEEPSRGVFGERIFLFTDDLDVTNRLYYDLQDAEGYDAFGRPDNANSRRPRGSLANLRSTILPDRALRLAEGQSWDLAEELGHDLEPPSRLRIGRTSSQDVGVETQTDVIVATAALEVGFNDSTIGAIIQHKSPRNPAQFVQRRGRAGRIRHMRPWTVVVLSDYGRDRITYQSYERLFDPELEPQRLPIRNRYILRMQAVYSLMGYLSERLRDPPGSIWQDLSGPSTKKPEWRERDRKRRALLVNLVDTLLDDPRAQTELAEHLSESLGLDEDDVLPLLWEPPRAILTEVLPTIRRRLDTNWHNPFPLPEGSSEFHVTNSPLPEFVPPKLFADLSLPEVTIRIPAATVHDDESEQMLPVAQAIREFAPGRVTRRYATGHGFQRHWIPAPLEGGRQSIDLAEISQHRQLIDQITTDGLTYNVFRPWELNPIKPPSQVLDSSNATPHWRTRIDVDPDAAHRLEPTEPSAWSGIVTGLDFFTHSRRAPAFVLRAAIEADGSVNLRNGTTATLQACFEDGGKPAALGFGHHVDAVRVRMQIPDLIGLEYPADVLRGLRTARFRDLVEADGDFRLRTGPFNAAWLARIYLSCLVAHALADGLSLEQARAALGADLPQAMIDVTDRLFGALALDETDQESSGRPPGRLRAALTDLINDPDVVATLDRNSVSLWSNPDSTWKDWLQGGFISTLGTAFLEACQRLMPNVITGDLVLDLQTVNPSQDEVADVWISEITVGGAGVIEELANRYAEDPRRFFRLVEAALAPSDFELVDRELAHVLDLLQVDADLRANVQRLRSAESPTAAHAALQDLLRTLSDRGVFVCHSVIAAFSARILRPGSTASTDDLIRRLLTEWKLREELLGVEIDARIMAYAFGADENLDQFLSHLPAYAGGDRQAWRTSAIYSLLWARGNEVRSQGLSTYNPFAHLPATDRQLILLSMSNPTPTVDLSTDDVEEAIRDHLRTYGSVDMEDPQGEKGRLANFLRQVVAEPIEVDFLQVYPRIAGVFRRPHQVVRLELEEAFQ